MSSLWDVPHYLIMAFSLALDAPVEKASRVSFTSPPAHVAGSTKGAAREAVPGEDAWLRAVKTAASQSDILQAYGARIFVTSSGRYYVPAQAERAEILSLRSNRVVATRVLAAATAAMRDDIARLTGAHPTRGALLVAHVLGPDTAVRYARALARDPDANAASAVPVLASVIGGEKALTLAQLEGRLSRAVRANETQVAANGDDASAREGSLKGTLTKPEAKPGGALAAAR